MATKKRKSISKKTRFEVFKRDGFCCQYCGAHPPSVILHVDHIDPVAKGGGNEMDNLVTACQDCNQGKSDRLLGDIPQSLQEKAALILEKEAQIAGYQKVMAQKRERINEECERIVEVYELYVDGYTLTDLSRSSIRNFIEKLGVDDVAYAMEKACCNTRLTRSKIFRYFCGICWTKIKGEN